MNEQQTAIREQQKQSWNNFSGGWKKWDAINMDFLEPIGKEIITAVHPSGKDNVLDIAAGTGEPGLTIAAMLQGGKVTITDLSPDMLVVAEQNAENKGIINIETLACDVCELPFADNSFDVVTCRMGFMFFPDMQLAANEIYRVLKKGGRFATSVWNTPDKNFWVTAMMSTIAKYIQTPPPPPGAPGMFRCAAPGLIKGILEQAGFKNVTEKVVSAQMHSGTIDNYWNMLTEVGAPIVAALSKADDTTKQKIKDEVYGLLQEKFGTGTVAIDASALLLSGEK
ncbi:MAG: class I SAM-dependent methyltransferase [Chitinophagaceae bacterium]